MNSIFSSLRKYSTSEPLRFFTLTWIIIKNGGSRSEETGLNFTAMLLFKRQSLFWLLFVNHLNCHQRDWIVTKEFLSQPIYFTEDQIELKRFWSFCSSCWCQKRQYLHYNCTLNTKIYIFGVLYEQFLGLEVRTTSL
jgi:hypothetical protein